MPKRIPTISIVVIRKHPESGKNVRKTVEPAQAGQPVKAFNFTDAEIAQINKIHPGALRKPVNESTVDTDEELPPADADDGSLGAGDNTAEEGAARKPTATKGKAKGAAKVKAAPAAAPAAEGSEGDDEAEEGEDDAEAGEDDDI